MGKIAESLRSELQRLDNDPLYNLLSIYENAYPADLAISLLDGGSIMDFSIEGGDIGLNGFFYYNSFNKILKRVSQDLLLRLLSVKGDTIFYPNLGLSTPLISLQTPDLIKGVVQIAAAESPFVSSITSVLVVPEQGNDSGYVIGIEGINITGDPISLGFNLTA